MKEQQLFQKLEQAWSALTESYTGLSDAQLTEPGVLGEWSIKDILAHVTTWEEEALKSLPLILSGGRPPRYTRFGGIDAFNAQMAEQKRHLTLSEVLSLTLYIFGGKEILKTPETPAKAGRSLSPLSGLS